MVKLTEHTPFEQFLLSKGYVEQERKEKTPTMMTDANLTIAFLHPQLRWAHISVFVRPKGNIIECTIHPQLIGERYVYRTLAEVEQRVAALEQRVGSSTTKVWSK